MPRSLTDFVGSFVTYLENTEVPPLYAKWTAFGMISAALRKKVYFKLGRLKTFPNLYLVLVGPPGIGKSLSLSFSKSIMNKIPDIILSAERVTLEQLYIDLEDSVQTAIVNDKEYKHSSLTILSKEFEVFLGKKANNSALITNLTDLYDCEEDPWRYRTKGKGWNTIPSVFLNIMAATTPVSLAESLPVSAIGSGLTARMLFVYQDKKYKKVPIPRDSDQLVSLGNCLVNTLFEISQISGEFNFSSTSESEYEKWYVHLDTVKRICTDPLFSGWYERKPLFVIKLALLHHVSKYDTKTIEWCSFEEAIHTVEELEALMEGAFRTVGKGEYTEETDTIMSVIKHFKVISEQKLLSIIWKDVDTMKFDNIIKLLTRSGLIEKLYEGSTSVYKWKGDKVEH